MEPGRRGTVAQKTGTPSGRKLRTPIKEFAACSAAAFIFFVAHGDKSLIFLFVFQILLVCAGNQRVSGDGKHSFWPGKEFAVAGHLNRKTLVSAGRRLCRRGSAQPENTRFGRAMIFPSRVISTGKHSFRPGNDFSIAGRLNRKILVSAGRRLCRRGSAQPENTRFGRRFLCRFCLFYSCTIAVSPVPCCG